MMGPSHGVRPDIAAEVDIPLPQGVEHSRFHRTDVSDCCVGIDLEAVHNKIGNDTWWHGDHNEGHVCRHGRLERAGTQASCDSGVADLVVTQMYCVTGRRECAPDGGPDQSSTDDHGPADPVGASPGGCDLGHVPGFFGGSSTPLTELGVGGAALGSPAGPDPSASRAASRSPLIRRNLRGRALVRSRMATSKASTPKTRGAAFGPPSALSARTASWAASARLRSGLNPRLTTSAITSAEPPITAKFASSATEPS